MFITRPGEMPDELRKSLNQVGMNNESLDRLMTDLSEHHAAHASMVARDEDKREFAFDGPPVADLKPKPARTWDIILSSLQAAITAHALPMELITNGTVEETSIRVMPKNEIERSFQLVLQHGKASIYYDQVRYEELTLASNNQEIAAYARGLANSYIAEQFVTRYPEFTKGNDPASGLLFGLDLGAPHTGIHFALIPVTEDGSTYLEIRHQAEPEEKRHCAHWAWKRWPGSEKIIAQTLASIQELRERPARGACRASHLLARLSALDLKRCEQKFGRIRTEHFVIDCYSHPPVLQLPGNNAQFGGGEINQDEAALLLPVLKRFGEQEDRTLESPIPTAPLATKLDLV